METPLYSLTNEFIIYNNDKRLGLFIIKSVIIQEVGLGPTTKWHTINLKTQDNIT